MNFDGLTDSVTNLVGNLILIVVLMLGLTKEVTRTEPPQAVSVSAPASLPPPIRTGTRRVEHLLLQAETLKAAIAQVDRDLGELEKQVPELQGRAEAVLKKARGGK